MTVETFRYMLYKWSLEESNTCSLPWVYMNITEQEYNRLLDVAVTEQDRAAYKAREMAVVVQHTDNAIIVALVFAVLIALGTVLLEVFL